ncbi:deoxyribodipyrimidine photo-lyase [Amphritea sp. 1_MG-2023]|uniref:cryptochrome/photolyase family protein n=1 Tax=Amphritea sp. 1_MG-2023 TaxID=3062670 RepID=UPI0026E1DA26|nr:deoxyribodipyrimidine photo-lyase [Amphritea sp. 1_MG-2023]MDO6563347.1 deoxyribodipyrimidine photo-lyase [Amphritea sp. 1_MG-2023]
MKSPVIVWLRHDLRLADNPALYYAAQSGRVIPVFIDDTTTADHCNLGAASRCWLHHSLAHLNDQLSDQLRIFQGDPLAILLALIQHTGAQTIHWNRCYTPHAITRDSQIKQALKSTGTTVHSYNGSLLWEPWTITKADGTPYKVFTPYYRKGCISAPPPSEPLPRPTLELYSDDLTTQLAANDVQPCDLTELNLLPNHPWHHRLTDHWEITEAAAWQRLQRFTNERLENYPQGRDYPALEATSTLSPYLQWGQISPRQIWYYSQQQGSHPGLEEQLDTFLKELAWREFSYYQLYHNPNITTENLNPRFNRFPWKNQPEQCHQWQQGMTGFPIIDAGMRELWQTGYMHNRVRMLVASFLVKNQCQHWHLGATWFWDTLVDADLASNSASWQWVAGCGSDAAPYFRIFNPVLQGQKFDAEGDYIRRFIPELSALPSRYIHTPWEASAAVLAEAGVQLGTTYPKPMLDLKASRQAALDAFASLKQQ